MEFSCTCYVQDGSRNTVVIQADENGEEVSYTCSCSSYWATWGACKHIVAALMYALNEGPTRGWGSLRGRSCPKG